MKIKTLSIQTPNLESQLNFYGQLLGLPISNKTDTHFRIKIGYSELEFHQKEKANPYHVAFHIGANQENNAQKWLEEKRIPILKDKGKEIIDFPVWNAKSIYFYDADNNIIELISRKDLFPTTEQFSEKSLVGIAEIGLATNDIEENFRFLERYFGLEIYFGKPEVFCALGDDEGLLIMVDKDPSVAKGLPEAKQKTWFPTNDEALPADFDVKFDQNGKVFELRYENGRLLGM